MSKPAQPMHVETIRRKYKDKQYLCHLLRRSWREDGKVKKETLANLSALPQPAIDAIRTVLKGEPVVAAGDAFEILRALPHGHVAAVLGTMKRLGIPQLLAPRVGRQRSLALALIAARILEPRSKLATASGLREETMHSSLGQQLGVVRADEDDLYDAMDWLGSRQDRIEKALADRHLANGAVVLYDLTSAHMEGRICPLAQLGYARDGRKGKLQIEFGLLTDCDGRPIAVEVFKGNTADPATVASQVKKLRERFGVERLILVGDRGMLTQARIQEDMQPHDGIDWISCLRAPAIAELRDSGALQLSLFDSRDLAEITSPQFPGERLVVCKNPLLAARRARKRTELLEATERELDKIVAATSRKSRPLRGKERIGVRLGRVLGRFKMGKHFDWTIEDDHFSYCRNEAGIAAEAALDGVDVVRTSVDADTLAADEVVRKYKSLSNVERAFRTLKTVDLRVRPVYHVLPRRVRAHVLVYMLAYYVEWHMRRALAPLLFDDTDPERAEAKRTSVVAPVERSDSALKKDRTRRTPDGLPVQSFRSLLDDLATLTLNRCRALGSETFDLLATQTPLQRRALDLLDVPPAP